MPNRWGLPTCHEAHRMLVSGMDRELSAGERLRLRAHLFACDACTRFSHQMRLLRQAMHRLGHEDDAAGGPR
ncbi:anti-sigma factor [Ralstonia solanacearum]|uniref:Zf-HC2 domain-containing protein n=1 Tax=Ralstonia solanacearum TaxID=305 RepID=A0AAW5ZMT6_RALSL|nr:zf-HC2 domain-containing protein [Ralstonia solanacearum]AST30747.2 zf-HC2 domain-containing protein [Ralstonia solanacearum]MDB0510728.1 zf-HC2 domain-containing protein [Ralstonia solanacearum]MDB0515714.1 zf-HC2 domain-containing protein [Ralstonia solanacearum]MDB0567866.1 zf-HC2 domain-containing protein [Ralstonia solanacearum]MDB0571284.1 zf-HC2 domain-containing protein [Ralstonia solanacearum]